MTAFVEDSIQFLPLLLKGALTTIQLMVLSLALATVLGMVLALMRLSSIRILRVPAVIIITILRGIPIFVQLLYIYFVFPEIGINLSAFQAGVFGLGIGFSAYHAENFRAGIISIDRGQYEAAKSIGMRTPKIMWRIILPQAVRIILPPYGNIMIMMLKDSSLASVITVSEMTRAGQLIASSTFKNMTVFTLVAILYLFMSLPMSALSAWLERRFKEK